MIRYGKNKDLFSEIHYNDLNIFESFVGKQRVWPDLGEIEIIIDQNETDPDKIVQIDPNHNIDLFLQWFYNNSRNVLGKYVGDFENGTGKLVVIPYLGTNDKTIGNGKQYVYYDGYLSKWSDHHVGEQSAGDELIFPAEIYYKSEEVSPDVFRIIFSTEYFLGGHKAFDGVAIGRQCCSSFWTNSKGLTVFGSNTSFGDCNNRNSEDIKQYARNRGVGYSMMNIDYRNIYTFLDILYSRSTRLVGTDYSGKGDTNRQLFNIISLNYDRRELVDNVYINNYVAEVTHNDGVVEYLEIPKLQDKYISKLHIGEYLNIIPKELNGTATTGFCGHVWTSPNSRIIPCIGWEGSGYSKGSNMLDMGLDGNIKSGQSSRIMFQGKVEVCLDSKYFDELPVLN